jgi:hypothetical protein
MQHHTSTTTCDTHITKKEKVVLHGCTKHLLIPQTVVVLSAAVTILARDRQGEAHQIYMSISKSYYHRHLPWLSAFDHDVQEHQGPMTSLHPCGTVHCTIQSFASHYNQPYRTKQSFEKGEQRLGQCHDMV